MRPTEMPLRPTLRSRLFEVRGLARRLGFAHDTPLRLSARIRRTVQEDMSDNSTICEVFRYFDWQMINSLAAGLTCFPLAIVVLRYGSLSNILL